MTEIGEFKDLHKGEPVCMLANGPSLLTTLHKIPDGMATFGMNASPSHKESPYWVGLDMSTLWTAKREGYKPEFAFLPLLEGFKYDDAGDNIIIRAQYGRQFSWSHDLEEVIYPCRSTLWFSLQVAAYMGFDPIFILGFDLLGPRPPGHTHAGEPMVYAGICHQLQLMGYLRGLLERGEIKTRIYNCSAESKCTCLPYHTPVDQKDWNPIGYHLHEGRRFEELRTRKQLECLGKRQ
jgi:hypothetical protein